MSKAQIGEQRLNVFIRLVAIILASLGLATFILTATTPLNPALASLFYLVALVFLGSGLLALVAKLEK